MVILEHRALAEKGAELVELRLDWLARVPQLGRLLKDRPTPVVITCRRDKDGGRWRGSEEQRLALLRAAIVEGVEYVDLEVDVARQIPRYGNTKRIISHHDFEDTPENLEEIHEQLGQCDPDIVKLVTMAKAPGDTIRLLKLIEGSNVPTIGFCMGEFGLASRLLCGRYGAPFTYATFHKSRELAPGQFAFVDMKDLYRFDAISGETTVFGAIGGPPDTDHTVAVQNTAFAVAGLNAVCVPLPLPTDECTAALDEIDWLGCRGYYIAESFREAATQWASCCDDVVEKVGNTDTLLRDENGGWRAANTMSDAAVRCLAQGLCGDASNAACLEGQNVLLLGAGRLAHVIGLGIASRAGKLTVASRTRENAVALADCLNAESVAWDDRELVEPNVLVNCTPVGMAPHVEESPFDPAWLRDGMLVFDTVQDPEETLLLEQASERGCRTVSGVELFVQQAGRQFEYFVDSPAPLDKIRRFMRQQPGAKS